MLIPLSWLKEYVDIKMPFPELAAKLSAAGLTVEVWHEDPPAGGGDIIFDPEITPNRPDWMCIYGIAREISAITGAKLKKVDYTVKIPAIKNPLPLDLKPNYAIVPRITSVIIKNVKVKPSPEWLAKRIKQIGLRPINNLVDITNYVLWTYGSLLHVFDYDKIRGHQLTVELSRGGEAFRSLDGIDYTLPKDAIVIKDVGRIIDLLPIKGGENTASYTETKNVLLHSVVIDPIITRRTSQALGLRSDSSAIAERGLDPNGTVKAVNYALALILELAGGEVASEIMDHKAKDFPSWTLDMNHERLEKVLGIPATSKKVFDILTSLELETTMKQSNNSIIYHVTVPTFRNDLHIEEDLIEEVGRIIGYDNFPKTLPESAVPTTKVAYARDYDLEYEVKQTLKGAGYTEIYTYSLVSEKQLLNLSIDPGETLRVDNPISREFEYLRPHLIGNLLDALKQNLSNSPDIRLYELGKVYAGKTIDDHSERYQLIGVTNGSRFLEAKGVVEAILRELGIKATFAPVAKEDNPNLWLHPGRAAGIYVGEKRIGMVAEVHPSLLARFGIKTRVTEWTLRYDDLEKLINKSKTYQPVPKYPSVVEDLSLHIPANILYGQVVAEIQRSSHLVKSIDLIDEHESSKTLRISYQSTTQNLSDQDVAKARKVILANLREKLKVKEKV